MSPGWAETYLGLIFQVYGLAFFVLGVAALLSMRRDTSLTAHLGWLAAFGMLHGLQARQGLCNRRPATASCSVNVTGAC